MKCVTSQDMQVQDPRMIMFVLWGIYGDWGGDQLALNIMLHKLIKP